MNNFKRGMKAGIPIGLGYLSVSFTFGIMAVSYGLSWWQALLISMTTVTSAGQFAGITTMMLPGQYIEMLISQLTINIRYSFMSVSLSQKVDEKFKGIWRWLFGFMMTDEIFAVASTEPVVKRSFFAGLFITPYFGWSLGTLIGALMGNVLPHRVMSALSLAIYGMFVAIVVPDISFASRRGRAIFLVVAIALCTSTLFTYLPVLKQVSPGFAISICAVLAAGIGAALFPLPEENAES